MKKSFVNYNEGGSNDTFIRCNYNIFHPEFSYPFNLDLVSDDGHEFNKKMVSFHSPVHLFSQTKKEWEASYTGGTTIKNTTFPELLKMVKKDCEQFKQGYLDYTGYENLSEQEKYDRYYEIEAKNLGWTYTPYIPEPPEPELTEEEKARNEAWEEQMRQETLENRANAVPIEDYYK